VVANQGRPQHRHPVSLRRGLTAASTVQCSAIGCQSPGGRRRPCALCRRQGVAARQACPANPEKLKSLHGWPTLAPGPPGSSIAPANRCRPVRPGRSIGIGRHYRLVAGAGSGDSPTAAQLPTSEGPGRGDGEPHGRSLPRRMCDRSVPERASWSDAHPTSLRERGKIRPYPRRAANSLSHVDLQPIASNCPTQALLAHNAQSGWILLAPCFCAAGLGRSRAASRIKIDVSRDVWLDVTEKRCGQRAEPWALYSRVMFPPCDLAMSLPSLGTSHGAADPLFRDVIWRQPGSLGPAGTFPITIPRAILQDHNRRIPTGGTNSPWRRRRSSSR